MASRLFLRFFVVEVLVIAVAVMSFRFIPERIFAGVVAGSAFTALGTWIFWSGARLSRLRRTPTYWFGCLHLFVVALPMMITRFLNHSAEFKDVLILGLPGPVFHQLSTGVYFALLAATAFDFARAKLVERKKKAHAS